MSRRRQESSPKERDGKRGDGFFGEGRKMSERVEILVVVKCSGEEEGRCWGGGRGRVMSYWIRIRTAWEKRKKREK